MLVHSGAQDNTFASMFKEGMQNFKIPQFGAKRVQQDFELKAPTLLNGRYVVYRVCGTDNKGQFQG